MTDLADLIRSLAALLWPILSFFALCMFKTQLQEILARLKRGKIFGQEVELDKSLQQLNVSAEAAASEVPPLPQLPALVDQDVLSDLEVPNTASIVIAEATKSPKVALIMLSSELEKEVRQLIASLGLLEATELNSFSQSIQKLENRGSLPSHLAGSISNFRKLRNELVHGHKANDDDLVRAIDAGLTILRTIQAVPCEVNVVYHPGVEIYSDALGTERHAGVMAVILETTSPGGAKKDFRVYPTTRTHFEKGRRVAWEWNKTLILGESWYRDPDSKKVAYGWGSSMEFVGRNLDDL